MNPEVHLVHGVSMMSKEIFSLRMNNTGITSCIECTEMFACLMNMAQIELNADFHTISYLQEEHYTK